MEKHALDSKQTLKLVQTQAKPRIVRIDEASTEQARSQLEIPTETSFPLETQATRVKRPLNDSQRVKRPLDDLHELLIISEQKRKESLHKITDLQGRL